MSEKPISIPQDIIEANGIRFNHESNEYILQHECGFFINIPSNATENFYHLQGIAYGIKMGNIILILWNQSCSAPHVTVLPF